MSTLNITKSFINSYPKPEKETEIYDSEIQGLALRVYPSGYKSFVYRFKWNGNSKRYTIGKYPTISLSDAKEQAKDLTAKIRLGINPIHQKKKRIEIQKDETFQYLKNEFISKYLPSLKQRTFDEYKRLLDVEFKSLNNYQLNEITKKQILKILDKKAYINNHPTQANRMRATLSSMFTFGVKRDLLESNIVLSIPTYPNGKNRKERFYSNKEIKIIWQFINSMPRPTQSIYKILFLTGQRKTETLKMKWNYIDFKSKTWTIPPQLAKNNQSHTVPLSTHAIQVLRSERENISKDCEYVFSSPVKSNQPIKEIKFQKKQLQKNTSVKDFTPHDIRRTVATHLAKLGTNRTTIGKILNHKGLSGDNSVTAIYDRYNYSKEKRKALEDWESHLLQLVQK